MDVKFETIEKTLFDPETFEHDGHPELFDNMAKLALDSSVELS